MNQLSWMLYWADALPSLAVAIRVLAGLGALIFGIFWMFNAFDRHPVDKTARTIDKFGRVWPPLIVVFLLTFAVPSRDTFYAIAVSETGEQVLKTPEVGKARQALNAWLDKQIAKEVPKNGS